MVAPANSSVYAVWHGEFTLREIVRFGSAAVVPFSWPVSLRLAADESSTADSIDRDYAADLPRIPSLSPTEALKSFEVEPGFALEQAAVEPQVTDPVALDFDEQGRLFVVEMLGYSENAGRHARPDPSAGGRRP
jgi:hypothetical protein